MLRPFFDLAATFSVCLITIILPDISLTGLHTFSIFFVVCYKSPLTSLYLSEAHTMCTGNMPQKKRYSSYLGIIAVRINELILCRVHGEECSIVHFLYQ